MKYNKLKQIGVVFGVTLSIFLTVSIVLAWTEPSLNPPGGNVAQLFNLSGDSQTFTDSKSVKVKEDGTGVIDIEGGLGVHGVGVFDGGIFTDKDMEVGSSEVECSLENEGAIRYTEKEFFGCSGEEWVYLSPPPGTATPIVDSRDGQVYDTIKIGDQYWMAENLNYDNGCYTTDHDVWSNGTYLSCSHNQSLSEEEARETYGLLYQWEAAMDGSTTEGAQGLCPAGWRIPTDAEWHALEEHLTAEGNTCDSTRSHLGEPWGCDSAGGALKESGTELWNTPNECGLETCNSSGFSALPGNYSLSFGPSDPVGSVAVFWTSKENNPGYAWRYLVENDKSEVNRSTVGKGYGISVRCIKK